MLQGWFVATVALAYLGALFAIAYVGDRRAARWRAGRWQPTIYALSLAVYCTSWTFYGSVGLAATSGFEFLPIYIGPALMFLAAYPVLRRIVRVGKTQNSTSVADFVAARYGKSQGLAALVSFVAMVGVIPYIALQLKAVSASFEVLLTFPAEVDRHALPFWQDTALYVAASMAAFAILFGVRHIHASEHHHGMILAIAFESVVKLAAFLAVGGFVVLGLFDGVGDLAAHIETSALAEAATRFDPLTPRWAAMTLLAAIAIVCLPRQFLVTVVENPAEGNLKTAAWLFPLYLLAINLFVVPVATAGLLLFPDGGVDRDMFVLAIPLAEGRPILGLFVFLGGLSAATAMVVVSSVAISTMLCNEIVLPPLLRLLGRGEAGPEDMGRLVRRIRRGAIVVTLGLAYLYYAQIGGRASLAAIGLLSFAAVAQIGPALFIGLFWRRAARRGVFAGLSAGFLVWGYTLVLPVLVGAGLLPVRLVADGPWGIAWLRPEALFGLPLGDPLTHGTFWSLAINLALYVGLSLGARRDAVELRQAELFCGREPRAGATSAVAGSADGRMLAEFERVAAQFLGAAQARRAFAGFRTAGTADPDTEAAQFTERLLSGAIGAASARIVMATLRRDRGISRRGAQAILSEASEAIRIHHDLLRSTLENITQGVGVFDTELRLAVWNARLPALLGRREEEMRVGMALAELDGDGADAPIGGLLTGHRAEAGGRPRTAERRLADGRTVELTSSTMPDGGFVVTVTDVTGRREAEWALQRAYESLELRVEERTRELVLLNDKLRTEIGERAAVEEALRLAKWEAEQANLSKTRFLAAASHDLLQPLNAARLFASALAERPVAAADGHLIEQVDLSLKAVEELLSGLLDISRLDAGGLAPEIDRVPVGPLLAALGTEHAPLAERKGLRLTVRALDVEVVSDRRLLRRVLQNLLGNAIRYTREGGVVLGCRRRGDRLRIEVWDTGRGIPEDKRQLVFQEFQRLETAEGDDERGLGLGLAIVDRLSRMLGHPVSLRSRLGRGTVFAVEVPLAVRRAAPAPPAAPRRPGAGLAGLVVLCVDDEESILAGMRALLAGWQCTVATARTAAEALALVESGAARPDLVLADYRLAEGETGLGVLDRLQALRPGGFAGVLVTADRSEGLRQLAREHGYEVLNKPLRPAQLRALLARLLQPREAAQ